MCQFFACIFLDTGVSLIKMKYICDIYNYLAWKYNSRAWNNIYQIYFSEYISENICSIYSNYTTFCEIYFIYFYIYVTYIFFHVGWITKLIGTRLRNEWMRKNEREIVRTFWDHRWKILSVLVNTSYISSTWRQAATASLDNRRYSYDILSILAPYLPIPAQYTVRHN